jgi:hypothetical protein
MTCSFCGARNNEGETRCRKCGRKPSDTLNGEFTLTHTDGALATKLQPVHFEADTARANRPPIRGVQQQLFPGQSNVVPIAMYSSPRLDSRPHQKKAAPRRRPVPEGQGALDFLPPEAPKPRTLSTTVEAVISCDFPVAPTVLRAVAGAIDCGFALAGYVIFLGMYFALGGELSWNRLNLEIFGGAMLLIGFTYGLVWTLAGADTAGMRIAGLRLTTFEALPEPLHHGGAPVEFSGRGKPDLARSYFAHFPDPAPGSSRSFPARGVKSGIGLKWDRPPGLASWPVQRAERAFGAVRRRGRLRHLKTSDRRISSPRLQSAPPTYFPQAVADTSHTA